MTEKKVLFLLAVPFPAPVEATYGIVMVQGAAGRCPVRQQISQHIYL